MTISAFATLCGVIGIPSIAAIFKLITSQGKKIQILMEAQQKQMARDLTMDYKMYMKQGFIEDDDMEIWESNYQKYHALGANGVMDSRRQKLLALPNKEIFNGKTET